MTRNASIEPNPHCILHSLHLLETVYCSVWKKFQKMPGGPEGRGHKLTSVGTEISVFK
jgi:hypothetical protein